MLVLVVRSVGLLYFLIVSFPISSNAEDPRNSGAAEGNLIWPGGGGSGDNAGVDEALLNPLVANKQRKLDQASEGKPAAEPRNGFTFGLTHTSTPILVPQTVATTLHPLTPCTCVPYYYCDEGQVVSDGTGVIDIRNGWPCKSILEVCCRSPRPTPPPQHPQGPTPGPPAATSTAIPGFNPRCGTLNPNGINARILGFKDSETQFGEYPWMAAILEKKYIGGKWVNYFVCGASLVWPSVIVTAAHCVYGKRPAYLIVRLGEWDTQSTSEFYPFQDIGVREIVVHPQFYGGALYNDMAVVFLQKPAVLAPHIDTICLPNVGTPNYENGSCWATGWGKNSFGRNGSYSAILKEVELPLIPQTNCQEALRRTNLGPGFILHNSFLCAGGLKNQDTCVGDGGGPLVCPSRSDPWRYVLAGVVSWGVNCGTYGVPAAYVDVTKFRSWIDATIVSRVPNYDVSRVTIPGGGQQQQLG